MMTPCPECKKPVSTDATLCPHCGKPLAITPEYIKSMRKRGNIGAIIGIIAALLIVIIFVSIWQCSISVNKEKNYMKYYPVRWVYPAHAAYLVPDSTSAPVAMIPSELRIWVKRVKDGWVAFRNPSYNDSLYYVPEWSTVNSEALLPPINP